MNTTPVVHKSTSPGRRIITGFALMLNVLYLLLLTLALIVFFVGMQRSGLMGISILVKGLFLLVGFGTVLVILISNYPAINIITAIMLTAVFAFGQWTLNPDRLLQFPTVGDANPVPYLMFTGEPEVSDHNELGYRGELPPPEKGDEFRVIMIGGSTVYEGNPLETSIPAQLQMQAREQGYSQVAVYNWGVVSQLSGMEISSALHRATRYQPDLVIFYNGGNDLSHPYLWDPRPQYPYNFQLTERSVALIQDGDLPTLSSVIIARSNLLRFILQHEISSILTPFKQLRDAQAYRTEAWEQRIVEGYFDNMTIACGIGRGFDFDVAIFFQPMLVNKAMVTESEQTFYNPQAEFFVYLSRQSQRGQALFAQAANTDNCYRADVSQIFATESATRFTDWIHVNEQGRFVIAAALLDQLETWALLPDAQ